MSRKSRIAAALASAGLLSAAAPMVAFAGGPLLSGYGGPGAGEQAIVGSTLLGGPSGGAGSGGAGEARPSTGPGGGLAVNGTPPRSGGLGGGVSGTSRSGAGSTRAKGPRGGSGGATHNGAVSQAYAYPRALTSSANGSSPIDISSGDVLPLVGIVLTLGLVAVLTVRVSRLQR